MTAPLLKRGTTRMPAAVESRIEELYRTAGLSCREIGAVVGYEASSVRLALKRRGVARWKRGSLAVERKRVRAAFNDRLPPRDDVPSAEIVDTPF